jgi:SAM-dependent methyltransferase
MTQNASNRGYGASAETLIAQYESITFEQVHGPVLRYFPAAPGRALDIGAGTGRDAAALARQGYAVTAVEPTTELRAWGQVHHPAAIRWIDDMLPALDNVRAWGERFEIILLTAVWMHLDTEQQRAAMQTLATLVAPGGRISMTLRHGPVPEGRRMFDVSADEVTALAHAAGMTEVHLAARQDMLLRSDVNWTFLVLERL